MPQIDLGPVEVTVFEPETRPVMTSQDPESVLIREEESDASR